MSRYDPWGSSFQGPGFPVGMSFHRHGYIAQSPQSGPRWSPAFKMEPVLFPPSVVTQKIKYKIVKNTVEILYHSFECLFTSICI